MQRPAISSAKASPEDRKRTIAHTLDDVIFNASHAVRHTEETAEAVKKLSKRMKRVPEVAKEANKLNAVRSALQGKLSGK